MEQATTLEDDLKAAGDDDLALNQHQCLSCGKWHPAFGLTNVKHNDHWPDIDYVCGHCIMNFQRQLNAMLETLAKAVAPPRKGPKPEEIIAEKRRLLTETLWATATDGTVTPAEAKAWGAYRKAVAAIDPKTFTSWPDRPGV